MTEEFDPIETSSPMHGFRGDPSSGDLPPLIPRGLTLAVSRETGARGGSIGRRVARKLGWQVYDQEMIQFLANESSISIDLSDELSQLADEWIQEQFQVLSKKCDLSTSSEMTGVVRAILSLAASGNVVLIGRGAGFLIPPQMRLHVRLISPIEERVKYLQQWLRLTREEAVERASRLDRQRSEYLRGALATDPDDLHHYDLVLSSHALGEDLCVDILAEAALKKNAVIWGS